MQRLFGFCARGVGLLGRSARAYSTNHPDPNVVLPAVNRVARIVGKSIESPVVVIIGNQSSGKSSVLDALVGESITPKGTNMVTCRPMEATLVRSETGMWAQFADGQKLHNFEDVRERILEENQDIEFSSTPLRLTIHSPKVHPVTLVDLPGYISIPKKD